MFEGGATVSREGESEGGRETRDARGAKGYDDGYSIRCMVTLDGVPDWWVMLGMRMVGTMVVVGDIAPWSMSAVVLSEKCAPVHVRPLSV